MYKIYLDDIFEESSSCRCRMDTLEDITTLFTLWFCSSFFLYNTSFVCPRPIELIKKKIHIFVLITLLNKINFSFEVYIHSEFNFTAVDYTRTHFEDWIMNFGKAAVLCKIDFNFMIVEIENEKSLKWFFALLNF